MRYCLLFTICAVLCCRDPAIGQQGGVQPFQLLDPLMVKLAYNYLLTHNQLLSILDSRDQTNTPDFTRSANAAIKALPIDGTYLALQNNSLLFNQSMNNAFDAGRRNLSLGKDLAMIAIPLLVEDPWDAARASFYLVAGSAAVDNFYSQVQQQYGDKMDVTKNGFFQSPSTLTPAQLTSFRNTDFTKVDFAGWAANSGVSDPYVEALSGLSADDRASYLQLLQDQAKYQATTNPDWNTGAVSPAISTLAATSNVKLLLSFQKNQKALIDKTDEIQETVTDINTHLNELSEETDNNAAATKDNAANIEYLKLTMYSNLSSADKLKWIQSNFLNLPEDQKKMEELQLKEDIVSQDRKKLVESVNGYFQLADASLNFLQEAGINDPVLNGLAKAASYGVQGTNIVDDLLSQNYVGAITGLGKLVFGGGPSPEQQIMNMLQEQDKKLNEILDNEKITFQLLQEIDGKLDAMAKMEQQYFESVLDQLYDIKWGIKVSLDLQKRLIGQPIDEARNFLAIERLHTYEDKNQFWKQRPDYFNDISKGFETLLGQPDVHPYFLLPYFVTDSGSYVQFRNKKFSPLFNQYLSRFPKMQENNRYTTNLSMYTPDFETLSEKYSLSDSSYDFTPPFNTAHFSDLLDPTTITDVANLLIRFGRLRVFADNFPTYSSMKKPLDLITDSANAPAIRSWNRTTRHELLSLLKIINLSIAQQQLLTGDILIPGFAASLDDSITKSFLRTDTVLQTNVMLYYTRSMSVVNGITPPGYSFLCQLRDSNITGRLFIDSAHTGKYSIYADTTSGSTAMWLVIDSSLRLQFPAPDQYDNGRFILEPTLQSLIQCKTSVAEEIADFGLKALSNPEELRAANLSILLPKLSGTGGQK